MAPIQTYCSIFLIRETGICIFKKFSNSVGMSYLENIVLMFFREEGFIEYFIHLNFVQIDLVWLNGESVDLIIIYTICTS